MFSLSQTGTNAFITDCFKITYVDSNDINLESAIPMSENDALNLTPYTFTISNICNHVINYNINLAGPAQTCRYRSPLPNRHMGFFTVKK